MTIGEDILAFANENGLEVQEKKGGFVLTKTVAERKAFLSTKKLVYTAKIRIDEEKKEVTLLDWLKETGFGLSSGDGDLSPGFGSKTETFDTTAGIRKGTIKEQSDLFGKKYDVQFDFSHVRDGVERSASAHQYSLRYA